MMPNRILRASKLHETINIRPYNVKRIHRKSFFYTKSEVDKDTINMIYDMKTINEEYTKYVQNNTDWSICGSVDGMNVQRDGSKALLKINNNSIEIDTNDLVHVHALMYVHDCSIIKFVQSFEQNGFHVYTLTDIYWDTILWDDISSQISKHIYEQEIQHQLYISSNI